MFPLTAAPANLDTHRDEWLEQFHRGDRVVLSQCYCEHFTTVSRAAGTVLTGVDLENAIHDFFARLIGDEPMRRSFRGGAFAGWLWVSARRSAIDVARARKREREAMSGLRAELEEEPGPPEPPDLDAPRLIAEFRAGPLPKKWDAVFEARFLRQLSQREAAAELHMTRTTLAYQELRIRHLLRKFLLARERP
jgi:RNA polymerase sigma-70 factor (ECF subfamily)